MLKCIQVFFGGNVASWRQPDAASYAGGLVAPIYPRRSEALSHSSDKFLSRREPTVGIYNFSNSTSLWGRTSLRRKITKRDWACVVEKFHRFFLGGAEGCQHIFIITGCSFELEVDSDWIIILAVNLIYRSTQSNSPNLCIYLFIV